ncbi:Mpo1 family 2-hydroxy fatty acid dioxygenase [Photobacterium sp. Hal280]|uniref:Mpo1 family 2-hydroxy fatty acid dioxygenase n=1 Tax=Photobacterium sp. Hal280 TaxID=3035163 RepID=UPI00301D6F74
MKTLEQQLTQYARYHRSKRNIRTHFVGIPLIVFAVICLFARVVFTLGGIELNGAYVAVALSVLYYVRLSLPMGLMMAVVLSVMIIAALPIAALPVLGWLGFSLSLFFLGWVIQFIGHYFEGKKPAFVDDLAGLIIGPLFVLAEVLFLLGWFTSLEKHIVQHAGPIKP